MDMGPLQGGPDGDMGLFGAKGERAINRPCDEWRDLDLGELIGPRSAMSRVLKVENRKRPSEWP